MEVEGRRRFYCGAKVINGNGSCAAAMSVDTEDMGVSLRGAPTPLSAAWRWVRRGAAGSRC